VTQRGRPRSREGSVQVIQVKLRLYADADDDLLAFFAHTPPRLRAAMVKQALRFGVHRSEGGPPSQDDELLGALDALVDGITGVR